MKLSKRYGIEIVQIYAPISSAYDVEIENFYADILLALSTEKTPHCRFIIGDVNVKLGVPTNNISHYVGKFGLFFPKLVKRWWIRRSTDKSGKN